MFNIIDQGLLSHDPDASAFIPTVTPLSDGTFVAVQQVGTGLASQDHHIEILRSTNGRDWRSQGPVGYGDDSEEWSYMSPQIWEAPDRRLMLRVSRFWHRNNPRQFVKREVGDQTTGPLVRWSTDGGVTWTSPQFITAPLPADEYTYHTMGNVIAFSAQHWMFPLQLNSPKHHYTGPNHHGAAALFTTDGGRTYDEFAIVGQDPGGVIEYHDQFGIRLDDSRVYTMLWSVDTTANADLPNHYVVSTDCGRTWSQPAPTNLRGQVCAPIMLADGRIAAVYNYRHEPQGIHLVLARDFRSFAVDEEIVVFAAGSESVLGELEDEHYLTKNAHVAFGRPNGVALTDGTVLIWFWCTVGDVTHTRWVRVAVDD